MNLGDLGGPFDGDGVPDGFHVEGTRAERLERWREAREAREFDALCAQLELGSSTCVAIELVRRGPGGAPRTCGAPVHSRTSGAALCWLHHSAWVTGDRTLGSILTGGRKP